MFEIFFVVELSTIRPGPDLLDLTWNGLGPELDNIEMIIDDLVPVD